MVEGVAVPLLARKYFPRELYEVLKALAERELSTMEIARVAGVSHTFLLGVLPSLEDGGVCVCCEGTNRQAYEVRQAHGRGAILTSSLRGVP